MNKWQRSLAAVVRSGGVCDSNKAPTIAFTQPASARKAGSFSFQGFKALCSGQDRRYDQPLFTPGEQDKTGSKGDRPDPQKQKLAKLTFALCFHFAEAVLPDKALHFQARIAFAADL
nr:hypothetical protein [uncultured Cohaesibacter sp.]